MISRRCGKGKRRVTIPDWEQTPEAVEASMKDAIRKGECCAGSNRRPGSRQVTFKSTVVALDEPLIRRTRRNKATIIKESTQTPQCAPREKMRSKLSRNGRSALIIARTFTRRSKPFADTHPKLTGEDEKLLKKRCGDYRRAGLELPPDQPRKSNSCARIVQARTDFDTNS